MLGFRAVDLVAEYTGHPYDNVLSAYFAEARMYDAADRRFLAKDLIKGTVANPLTMVPYTYVLDNPFKYVDPDAESPRQANMLKSVERTLMHNAVINDIRVKNPQLDIRTNQQIKYSNGRYGFADMIIGPIETEVKTGKEIYEIYDVKSAKDMDKTGSLDRAKNQVTGYTEGSWSKGPDNIKLRLGGTYDFKGEFITHLSSGYYFVKYSCGQHGEPYLIEYTYQKVKKSLSVEIGEAFEMMTEAGIVIIFVVGGIIVSQTPLFN
jgi:RHS repeat-associated protein